MDRMIKCSGLVPGISGIPGTPKPAPIGRCSGCSGCSGLFPRAHVRARKRSNSTSASLVREIYTRNTRNTRNKSINTGLSKNRRAEHSPEHGPYTRNMTKPKPMRQAMPWVTARIDELRAAFGADLIDPSIRAGIDGQPTFHAIENGIEVGTPIPYDPARAVSLVDIHIGPLNLASSTERKRNG